MNDKKVNTINAVVLLNLLEEVYTIGQHLPEVGIGKLKQIIDFLKKNP